MKILSRSVFLAAVALSSGGSRAQTNPDYCQRFLNELTFPPKTSELASAVHFDRDRGVQIQGAQVTALKLVQYSSELAHRIESQPQEAGALKDLKLAMQIFDKGGEPREFQIVHEYLENYSSQPKKKTPPLKAHVFRYDFAFRNGVCVPIKTQSIAVDAATTVFDLDRCYDLVKLKKTRAAADRSLACESQKVFSDVLNDPRFEHESRPQMPSSEKKSAR